MPSPRNPTRRNRNIGTAKQGHGADNRLVIPDLWRKDGRWFAERLVNPREVPFVVHGDKRIALVEEPSDGFFYGCTVSDLEHLLHMVPAEDLEGLEVFLFRNPTRKQRTLSSVWGRMIYFATPGHYAGSAVCFESNDLSTLTWSRSLNPEGQRELERLREDGHRIEVQRRGIDIHLTPESFRATTLFRTALHEIGHYVDWMESVIRVEGSAEEEQEASRLYSAKPKAMKEDFAHRYAAEALAKLTKAQKAPFPVQWDTAAMAVCGVRREWFLGNEE